MNHNNLMQNMLSDILMCICFYLGNSAICATMYIQY